MMKLHGKSRWHGAVAALAIVAMILGLATPGLAQNVSTRSGDYSLVDLDAFIGGQWFAKHSYDRFDAGPLLGLRLTGDFSRYVGAEGSVAVGVNNVHVPTAFGNTVQFVEIHSRNVQLALMPVFYFRPRESKFRPFFRIGPGVVYYHPTNSSIAGIQPLDTKYGPALIYGTGIKVNAWKHFGLRFDFGGMWTERPHFSLPAIPSANGLAFIPRGGTEFAAQASVGLIIHLRVHEEEIIPPPPPPPAPKEQANIQIESVTGAADVCPGDAVNLHVTARGWLSDQTPTYQWTVNGQPAGQNSADFSLNTRGLSGAQTVTVQVSAGGSSKTSDTITIRLKDYHVPAVTVSASPSTIERGQTSTISANAQGSDCSGDIRTALSASEGSISGNIFDSSSVSFNPNQTGLQNKRVTITATATDSKGGTGTANTDVTVTQRAQAQRLDDIDFANGSSRVNNCAKRLLLEVLTPMLRNDPNAKVILVGHRDAAERGRGAAELDHQRVLNAAAVLSAGKGICPRLELDRLLVNWVGTNQDSAARPSFCGSSVKERTRDVIRESDANAKNRRVEIWFVPSGSELPAGLSGLKAVPASELRTRGCPK